MKIYSIQEIIQASNNLIEPEIKNIIKQEDVSLNEKKNKQVNC